MGDETPELWQAVVEFLARFPSAVEPLGRDRGRVEEVLAELYLLGERPSIDQMRSYLESLPASTTTWQRPIVALWRERLRRPAFSPASVRRSGGWVCPFYLPDLLATEHGLRSVRKRLAAAIADAALRYIDQVEREPDSKATDDARAVYEMTARAVRLYALSRDRIDDRGFPSVTLKSRARDNLFLHFTRTGRVRYEAWVARLVRERDEEEARWRGNEESEPPSE